MAVRTTFGRRSRTPGTTVGVQVSTFGLDKLIEGVNGEAVAKILMDAAQPSKEYAYNNWAYLTGASRDSIDLFVSDVEAKHARVVLQVGGEKLINDPRNTQHIDYAPFLEFNGSPGGTPAGVLRNSIYDRDTEIRRMIRDGVAKLIEDLTK